MHFCTARIALAGDTGQIAIRDRFSPVSWPELEVIKTLHGDDALLEVQPFVKVPQPPKAERDRQVETPEIEFEEPAPPKTAARR